MPFSLAIFSALWPMVRPVEYSAMAGGTGTRSLGWRPAKARTRSGSERARLAFTRARERGRLVKMGTSLIDSVPPAMATRLTPRAIAEATSVNAWMDVAQALETEWASMPRGSAEARPTSRAMLGARSVGMAWPKTTWSISAGSMSARWTSSRTTAAPSSSEVREPKTPPALTKGVRSPLTTTARDVPG